MVKETDFILKGYSSRCFFWKLGESPKISFVNDQDYVGQVGKSQNSVRTNLIIKTKSSSNGPTLVYNHLKSPINQSVDLPSPHKPTYFMRSRIVDDMVINKDLDKMSDSQVDPSRIRTF